MPDPPHGTRARYALRGAPCRCLACRTANAHAIARWRATGSTLPPAPRPRPVDLEAPRCARTLTG